MLVVDTNQIGPLPRPGRRLPTGLILSPSILAEILLRTDSKRTRDLRIIARYDATLGKEAVLVGAEIGQAASAREIALYRPFYGKRSPLGQRLGRLLREADKPDTWWLGWAKEHKDQHRDLMREMVAATVTLRKRWQENKVGRARNWNEVIASVESANSYCGSLASMWIKPGPLQARVGQQTFYDNVRANPYALGFLYAVQYWSMALARGWADQKLNRDPDEMRDDWSDLTLALYVRKADSVVSADGFVRQMFAMISPSTKVLRAHEL